MYRAVFILVTVFWLTMNVLLWQTQFGSRKNESEVPVAIVWEKVLTAADDSSLTVFHHGKLVGACHLRTAVGEEWSKVSDENVPTGPLSKARGYRLSIDGSAIVPELTNRLRFDGELKLGKRREWQVLDLRLTLRPTTWEIHSAAADQNLHLTVRDGKSTFDVTLRFSDLNITALGDKFGAAGVGEMLSEAGLPTLPRDASQLKLGLQWDAHDDSIRIGRTAVQVYRLHTRPLGRYDVSATVSRAGEILRVELPDDFVLVNDRLAAGTESRPRPNKRSNNSITAPGARGTND